MTTTTDVTPLKEIQKFIWSQGDYGAMAREGMRARRSSSTPVLRRPRTTF